MFFLRQATASQNIEFGPFVSTSDGITVVTSAIAANDIKLFKNADTSQGTKNSGSATYLANGWYYAAFDATDTNTVGRLKVTINMTSSPAMPVWFDAMVVSTTVYDSLFNTTGVYLGVDIKNIAGSSSGANNFSSAANSVVSGKVTTTAPAASPTVSTCVVIMDFVITTDNQIQGRQIVWKGDVSTGLKQQATQVSTWTAATSTMTFPGLTVIPAHNDSFTIF